MAILKHLTSKNADYGEAQRYLMFQHDESTGKPILDENGDLLPREEYYLDGLNCNPFTFDAECLELNAKYHKNQNYSDVKSHHYIISFDPKDVSECDLSGERAQQLGVSFAKKYFPGHQALVCTHTDGHNGSGNIHVHIVINSLRKFDVEHHDFMERPSDCQAGFKHHQTRNLLLHLKQAVMDMCHDENLHQVDLLSPAEKKITDREYRARLRGQKKVTANTTLSTTGTVPIRSSEYQTQKDYLRNSIEEAAGKTVSFNEFEKYLLEKFKIEVKMSRGRISYLHPDRNKAITGRNLGTRYEKAYLISRFAEKTAASPDLRNHKAQLRLVLDLQQCVKAQQSRAYARRVKLTNLQQMAQTIAYVQEHGYNTRQDLFADFSNAQSQVHEMNDTLRTTEQALKNVNQQIHFTGQYLANKEIYKQYLKSNSKKRFRQEHSSEIALYEAARDTLKKHSNGGPLPSMKALKEEKEKLVSLKASQYETLKNLRRYQKELKTVCSNVDMILGNVSAHRTDQQKITEIS